MEPLNISVFVYVAEQISRDRARWRKLVQCAARAADGTAKEEVCVYVQYTHVYSGVDVCI